MKLPSYPNDFFNFGDGVNVTNEEINKTIERLTNELLSDDDCYAMASSTGNTKVSVSKDTDYGGLVIEVYKNYHRKYIDL